MTSILIGGTPGTGKTEVAKIVGAMLSRAVLSLGDIAVQSGCVNAKDMARDTGIIDEDCLVEAIGEITEDRSKMLVIEGHYIDLVPYSRVEKVFILRTHPEVLRKRLLQRGYSIEKVNENVEAEVIGVCQMDAIYAFGEDMVYEIDTTSLKPTQVAERIVQILNGLEQRMRIDWMQQLEMEGRLDEFLSE